VTTREKTPIVITAQNQENYDKVVNAGWVDSYLVYSKNFTSPLEIDCTSCANNNLRLTNSTDNFIFDYIFVSPESKLCVSVGNTWGYEKTNVTGNCLLLLYGLYFSK
jgi:hypothetical protein